MVGKSPWESDEGEQERVSEQCPGFRECKRTLKREAKIYARLFELQGSMLPVHYGLWRLELDLDLDLYVHEWVGETVSAVAEELACSKRPFLTPDCGTSCPASSWTTLTTRATFK